MPNTKDSTAMPLPFARTGFAHLRTARWGYPLGIAIIASTVIGLVVLVLSPHTPTTSRLSQLIWKPETSTPEYTAAIVYLISQDRMDVLPESLGKAQLHVNWRSQWPIILFHTGDFDTVQSQLAFYTALKNNKWSGQVYYELRNRIEFVHLDWTFPPGVSSNITEYKPEEFAHRWPGTV